MKPAELSVSPHSSLLFLSSSTAQSLSNQPKLTLLAAHYLHKIPPRTEEPTQHTAKVGAANLPPQ